MKPMFSEFTLDWSLYSAIKNGNDQIITHESTYASAQKDLEQKCASVSSIYPFDHGTIPNKCSTGGFVTFCCCEINFVNKSTIKTKD